MEDTARFRTAVGKIKALAGCSQKGLQALKKSDRVRVKPKNTRELRGSVNLDECLKKAHPQASRWDYAIGYAANEGEKVYYVEVHPAATSNVAEVICKHKWLVQWLKAEAGELDRLPREFWWVATNSVDKRITKRSKYKRSLSQHGIKGPTNKPLILR